MKLSEFARLLQAHPDKPFRLVLPGEKVVPVAFHITEVAHVQKRFIDCGGKLHTAQTCQLQAWVAGDTDHRLLAGKMAKVLHAARVVLPPDVDLEVEIEYEDTELSQYPVADYTVSIEGVLFMLAAKHTDCLAKESCSPRLPALSMAARGACCGPDCCTPKVAA